MRRTRRLSAMTALAAAASLIGSGIASADNVVNNLDASIDAAAEVMPLNEGGANGMTQLYVQPQNGDGKPGCNLTSSTALTLSVSSSNTSAATVSPSSVTFTSCGAAQTLTVTPVAQGSSTVSVSQTSNNTGATFNLAPSTFTVNVTAPAPSNAAPTVSVAGVTGGASYNKGSVPAATCQVTDAEDGSRSFAATLSAITGDYASDGIGSQTASCSYTDGGGLTASASETYSIADPSAPTIGYTLSPATADGTNGWYKSSVTLTWNVSEPHSPNSLQKTGCVDQNITADQAETTYSCSATSAGGSGGSVDVRIKRDAMAPVISGADVDDTVWRNSSLSHSFTASDGTSGLANPADGSFTLTAALESADATTPTTVSKTVTDDAGNSATRTVSALIDKTEPVISGADIAHTGWRNTPLSSSFTASDALSGLADSSDGSFQLTASADSANSTTPTTVSKTVADVAGNAATRTLSAFIDTTAPVAGFTGGPADGATYWTSTVPAAPTAGCSDALSGVAGCALSGYSATAGTHTITSLATDNAGNTASVSRTYTVRDMTHTGFYSPVDMGSVVNTVKGGSTVPLKFDVKVDGVEQTSTAVVTSFQAFKTTCGTLPGTADEIELVTSGSTSLRYDSTGGQFIQSWKTPTGSGCYKAIATLSDGDTITAYFKTR